jgi:hypothetical protein
MSKDEGKVYQNEFPGGLWFIAQSSTGKILQLGILIIWIAIWGSVKGYWMNTGKDWLFGLPDSVSWFWFCAIIQIGILCVNYATRYKQWGIDVDAAAEKDPNYFKPPADRVRLFDFDTQER